MDYFMQMRNCKWCSRGAPRPFMPFRRVRPLLILQITRPSGREGIDE